MGNDIEGDDQLSYHIELVLKSNIQNYINKNIEDQQPSYSNNYVSDLVTA